jgi:hypothetical protein
MPHHVTPVDPLVRKTSCQARRLPRIRVKSVPVHRTPVSCCEQQVQRVRLAMPAAGLMPRQSHRSGRKRGQVRCRRISRVLGDHYGAGYCLAAQRPAATHQISGTVGWRMAAPLPTRNFAPTPCTCSKKRGDGNIGDMPREPTQVNLLSPEGV